MSGRDDPDEMLAAAYALDGPEANRELYARWADTYDSEFVAGRRYVYPDQVADVFARQGVDELGSDAVIVDIGCGTGLAGQSLRRYTDVDIDGVDISPEMLRRAAGKHQGGTAVYRRLIEADLTAGLGIDTHTYAGAISVGTFTHGHVGPAALAEVVRIVRPGGYIALGINAAHFESAGFSVELDELVGSGRIADLQLVDVPIYANADVQEPNHFAHVAVFEVVGQPRARRDRTARWSRWSRSAGPARRRLTSSRVPVRLARSTSALPVASLPRATSA